METARETACHLKYSNAGKLLIKCFIKMKIANNTTLPASVLAIFKNKTFGGGVLGNPFDGNFQSPTPAPFAIYRC